MSILKELLEAAVAAGASDVHITPEREPFFRTGARLAKSDFEVMTVEYMEQIIADIIPPYLLDVFEKVHEVDFAMQEKGVGRFRVNVFLAQGVPAIAMRHVRTEIPSFDDLHLPPQLKKLGHVRSGIILLSGTSGSGKSSTLAAIINEINHTQKRRIITIEDPVEYLFTDDQSLITQREVGLDTRSFGAGLENLLRQDPDVILIGEMRDSNSIRTSLTAAATGHLVLSTVHSATSSIVIPRILDTFARNERDQVRMAIADNMQAVVCQRLIPATRGGATPAVEILLNTPTTRNLIQRDHLDQLPAAIETGNEDGMQSFNQSLYNLIKSGDVSESDGMRYSDNPEGLRMNLQGIFLDDTNRILGQ